jgi:hypothetical protein
MKVNFILLITSVFFISCNSKSQKKEVKPTQAKKVVFGEKFFEYDEIVHYVVDIAEREMPDLLDKENLTAEESLKLELLTGFVPKNINDTSFIKKLEKIGYTKKGVDKEKFAEIDSIFIEKKATERWETSCTTMYRNILLFKRQNQTIGVAKICFGCGKKSIVGTTASTDDFGFDGDYQKLESILKN